jgi:hypothetical protein
LPEGGSIANDVYTNDYFDLSFPIPADFNEKYKGPPPSDSGYYVLAQIRPADTFKGPMRGTILVAAQDLFFSLAPAADAVDLVKDARARLTPDYKVEREPTSVTFANHPFVRFDYVAPAADLHWYILSTEIRCHAVQFVFTSRDTKLIERLITDMQKMKLLSGGKPAAGGGDGQAPVCIKDYAMAENVVKQIEPVFTEHRFNPVPVRIIIGTDGSVEHIHFISAFPDQAKAITDAVMQWKFRPHLQNGEPTRVETGLMFGFKPQRNPAEDTPKAALTN